MIFFFFAGKTSPVSVFESMSSQADTLLSLKKKNYNPVQIEGQIPTWLRENSDTKMSGMGQFLQGYYDWLANEYGFEGVNLMNMAALFDIDETPEFLLPHFIETYAPDIKGLYDLPEEIRPSGQNIRNTIKNIKNEIYQKKSNEDAFRSLIGSLFSVNPETIKFAYPKRKILRLNGGILDWMTDTEHYGFTGEYSPDRYTVVGSHLNQGVMPDGKMWQEFSYLITSEIDDSYAYYESVVKEMLHPVGLLGIYEKLESYSEGGYSPGPVTTVEVPKIANYYPYTLGSVSTLPICSGCTGNLFVSGWTFPTFVYPSWADSIMASGYTKPFGEIKLSDFMYQLSTTATGGSPNERIGTNCTLSCGATGTIDFTWTVYRASVPYVGITGINVGEAINFENDSAYGFNRYLWQFGDGTTTDIEHPTKSYSSIGTFGVTLTGFKDSIPYQLSQKITSFIVS